MPPSADLDWIEGRREVLTGRKGSRTIGQDGTPAEMALSNRSDTGIVIAPADWFGSDSGHMRGTDEAQKFSNAV